LAAGAYFKEQSWYYDLARGWDGSVAYPGSPQGEEEHGKYTSWDCTGSYLLALSASQKSLYLTGKKPFSLPALTRAQADEVIAAGRDYFGSKDGYTGRSAEQLLAGLSSWSPAVRKRSAKGLGQMQGNFVPALTKMLAGPDRYSRYGACEALGCLGARADATAPQLRALLQESDPWLQSLACFALPHLSETARQASVNDLLRMATRENPNDPRRTAQRAVAVALFSPFPGSRDVKSILTDSLDGVDRALLYPAVRSLLQNEESVARGALGRIYPKLTDKDVAQLQ
jgi:HEAT repeat protein